jgi:hypothetical protein
MSENINYLVWLSIFFGIPLLGIWCLGYKKLIHYGPLFIRVIIVCVVLGSLWDVFAVAKSLWYWPICCSMLPRVNTIPLDELLFMTMAAVLMASLTLVVREVLPPAKTKRRK